MQTALFAILALFTLTPWSSPPLALLLGIILALTIGNPFPAKTKKWSKYLLQAAVVGLGFGLDISAVLKAGSEGLLFTILTISLTLIIGSLIGKALNVERKASQLISVGTAICGGSAIAAVGPVIKANDEEMSVALGTVFVLNSVALLLFPLIGHALDMSQSSFGLWAALAIHDTSSVVGATSAYGADALAIGTTVKLARALWIIPISIFFAYLERRHSASTRTPDTGHRTPSQLPWFIGLFLLASILRTLLPTAKPEMDWIVVAAKAALALTLFLIGAGLSRAVLKKVGYRPMALGVILWIIVGVSTLTVILSTR